MQQEANLNVNKVQIFIETTIIRLLRLLKQIYCMLPQQRDITLDIIKGISLTDHHEGLHIYFKLHKLFIMSNS